MAFRAVVRQADLAEPYPASHAADEPVPLRHSRKEFADSPAHEAKFPGVQRDGALGNRVKKTVESSETKTQPEWFLAVLPHPVNNVIPLAIFRKKGGNQLWRILQIGIEK